MIEKWKWPYYMSSQTLPIKHNDVVVGEATLSHGGTLFVAEIWDKEYASLLRNNIIYAAADSVSLVFENHI